MAHRAKVEARVGIFVFIALAILVYFVWHIGDFNLFISGYDLKVVFGFANGLKINAPVRVAGVDAGEVRNIRIFYDLQTQKTRVEVSFWVKNDTKIPRDSQVMINTLGLLGEKYLEVIPGSNYADLFRNGDILLGEDPVSMEEIGNLGRKIATKLEISLEAINKLVNDDQLRLSLKQAADNLGQLTDKLNLILNKINSGEGTLGKFVYDETLYQDLEALVADLKEHPWKLFFRSKK